MRQISVGSAYKEALNILLSIPFSPSIVDCYKQLLEEYTLKITKIALEYYRMLRKLARQLDLILQLMLTTKEMVTNEMKDVLDLWIVAIPREEILMIRQLMTGSIHDPMPTPSSTTPLNALSVVDVTISSINAQIINVEGVDEGIQGTMRNSASYKKDGPDQNLSLPKGKRREPASTFLISFPTNPCRPLLLVSPQGNEGTWKIFSPRPKLLPNLVPILEELVEPMLSEVPTPSRN